MASKKNYKHVSRCYNKSIEDFQEKDEANPSKNSRKKRKLSDMLSSQWNKEELESFYEAYRKHGRDWRKIAAAVRSRAPENVEALYCMNKAYLSLPDGTATAAGLIAMMTDHYNVLVGDDTELEGSDLSRTSQKASKRWKKSHLIHNGLDESGHNLLQYPSTSSSYGCLTLLRKQYSGGGSLPRVVGKRTPRVPIPYFANQDKNILSPIKQGLKPVLSSVDDDGAHIAAMTLAEASLHGGSVQISQTPSIRLGHLRQSPDPSERMFGDSKVTSSQMDNDHAECSLGSSEAESRDLSEDESVSEIQNKEKKFLGKRSKSVDHQKESCIATNEGLSLGKIKAENGMGIIVGKALQPPQRPKKKRHLFVDECSAIDALQTLANLTVNAPFPVSTDEFELHKGSPHDTKVYSETKHQICSSYNKMHKGKQKSPTERSAKPKFPSDFKELEYQNTEETLSHCFSSQLLRRWCKFEWFYSAIDFPWFFQNEFIEYLNHVGLNHIPKLTRVEWGVIRSSLGKPRRFSKRFLQLERAKLEEYRELVRSQYVEQCAGVIVEAPADLAQPLSVGQRVVACHPRIREIHDGSILTANRNQCRIQFDRPELGVELVMDIDCMPLNLLENMPQSLRKQNPANNKFSNGLSYLSLDESKDSYVRGSMMSSAKIFETEDGASNISSCSYPMSTSMNHSKGDKVDAGAQAKIQAREADVRALANLCSALDKKEALIMELRQMVEVYGKKNDGYHNLRNQLAVVRLQLPDVNKQVASALNYLQQRNTYSRNLTIALHKPLESSEFEGSFKPPPPFKHDSGPLVSEVFQSSREKAKAMVDVAVQAMHTLKEGEDAFHKIGEALNLESSMIPLSISSISTAGNALVDRRHDNATEEDHASCQQEAARLQAPCSYLRTSSYGNQASELISSCVATLFVIQVCSEQQYPPVKVAQNLDSALACLQPRCPQNLPVYKEIERCMGIIKNQMLSFVPNMSTVFP